jgi:hypothetical protein
MFVGPSKEGLCRASNGVAYSYKVRLAEEERSMATGAVYAVHDFPMAHAAVALQALLKTESQLRARETEADLLAESAGGLSSAAARTAAAALRNAAAAHDAEIVAANKRLRHVQAAEQRAVEQEAAQQEDAQQRIRCEQPRHAVLLGLRS